jgi:hypothetical protein
VSAPRELPRDHEIEEVRRGGALGRFQHRETVDVKLDGTK